jgi:hypothetical protein
MRSVAPHSWVAPVCLTLGLLAVVWVVLAFRSQRRYLRKALRATGVVQSLRAERMERTTMYFPVITFTTAAGATVTAESKTSKSSGYPIGKSIAVLYDPAHPDNMEIDSFLSRWVVVIVAISFAVILLFIGIAALVSPS